MKLFIDTWGWLTLRDRREAPHQLVRRLYRDYRYHRGVIYTSDYVLDETVTLLFRRLHFAAAQESLASIQQAIKDGYLHLEWVTPERFEKAVELRFKFQDKPQISFTDFTSMVIMGTGGITDVLTDDDHFIQVGRGFRKVP